MQKSLSNYIHANRTPLTISFVISIGFLLLYSYIFRHWIYDDAFITFRYAQNFIQGHGFVYNIGERTEGYTSFLWLLLVAIGEYLGQPAIFSQVLGIGFAVLVMCLLLLSPILIQEINGKTAAVATLLTTVNGVFNPWPISGIETTFFTCLLITSIGFFSFAMKRDSSKLYCTAGILFALLSMTRPEGLIITGTVILFLGIKKKDMKSLIALLVPFLLIYGMYFEWRYMYYGYLFPNTFYAKVGTRLSQLTFGLIYTLNFTLYFIPWFIVVATHLLQKLRAPTRNTFFTLSTTLCLIWTLYVVIVGGDYMHSFRFFAPLVPILGLITAHIFTHKIRDNRQLFLVISSTLLFHFTIFLLEPRFSTGLYYDTVASDGKEVGLWIQKNTPESTVIAVNTAGSTVYYAQRHAIDMLGLNDTYLAHLPQEETWKGSGYVGHEIGDGNYVLSRKPDIVIFAAATGSALPYFKGDIELYQNPEFHNQYTLKQIQLPSGKLFTAYWRNAS